MRFLRSTRRLPALRRSLLAFAALVSLAGCGLEGDFGELNQTLLRDDIHDWIGRDDKLGRPIAPSNFELTDDERQLRDLAFPLIEPPYQRQNFDQVGREYGLIRNNPPDRAAYYNHLMTINDRSATTRYAQLSDDVRNDITRMPQFFETASRVIDMDMKRRKSLSFVAGLDGFERKNALNRIHENARVIGEVRSSLASRAASYRFALERLVISVPSPQAVDVERTLNRMQAELARYRGEPAPTWHREPSLAFQR